MSTKSKDDFRNDFGSTDERRRENISDERSGTLSRRRFLGGMGAAAVAAAVGCKDRSPSGVDVDAGPDVHEDGGMDVDGGPDIGEDGGQEDGTVVVEDGGQNGGGEELGVLRAFPGAEGSGALSVGGRGGTIYEVTNLNDSGPGSLRAACEASGPRIVIFRVAGTIVLQDVIDILNPYITIAGQTAPGGGIQLAGKTPGTVPLITDMVTNPNTSELELKDVGPTIEEVNNSSSRTRAHLLRIMTHDVIVRYLRLRTGYIGRCQSCPQTGWATVLTIGLPHTGSRIHNVERVILDHCSVMWGSNLTFNITDAQYDDENFNIKNISLQNNVFAAMLYNRNLATIGANLSFGEDTGFNLGEIDLHRNLFTGGFSRLYLIRACCKIQRLKPDFYRIHSFIAYRIVTILHFSGIKAHLCALQRAL